MDCYICHEPSGFHAGRCYEYDVPTDLAGPKASPEFMPWFLANQKRERELKEAERQARIQALSNSTPITNH